jgi:hypothetical protein
LQESARNDLSVTSAVELAKFGFNTQELNLGHNSRGTENLIKFGSFVDQIDLNLPKENNQRFVGISFQRKLCEFLPLETLLQINDLRQAGYSDPHIMDTLKIPIVPPIDMVSSFIISCSKCGHMGHELSDCLLSINVSCAKCFGLNHVARACTLGWRCKGCKHLGHVLSKCPSRPTSIWRVKTRPSSQGQTKNNQQKIWRVKAKETNILRSSRKQTSLAVSTPLPIPQATVQPSPAAMAMFPVNPLAFLPEGMTIDHGPADRKVCTDLVISPNAPLHNDKVVIAETNRFIPIHL